MTVRFIQKVIKTDAGMAVIIPEEYLREIGVTEGDEVVVTLTRVEPEGVAEVL